MDSWHQTFLWLICVICINPAINVCQNNKVTGERVYIDSTGAPRGQTTVCKCCLTNEYPIPLLAITYNTSRESHDFQFEVSTFVFKEDTPNKRNISLDRTNIEITFTKTTMSDSAAGCLGFEIDPSSSSGNITITCYSADHSFSTTIATIQEQLSTGSSISVNPGIVAGAVVGGCCVVLIIVVVVIVAYKRRKQTQSNTRPPKPSNNPNEENDYYMTENALYNCNDDTTKEGERVLKSSRDNEGSYDNVAGEIRAQHTDFHDIQDDCAYATVLKTNDTHNMYDVTNSSCSTAHAIVTDRKCNQTNQAHSPQITENVYNKLHQSSSLDKNEEDGQDHYDSTSNATMKAKITH